MMKVKKIVIFSFCAISFLALIAGLCVFFLTNKIVDVSPSQVYVQKVDDKFLLTTDYNPNFNYRFKIEKFVGDDFITLPFSDSSINSIDLSQNGVDIVNGNKYRFSACYISSNGNAGKFCESYDWDVLLYFNKTIDYSKVVIDEDNSTISWDKVEGAIYYTVRIVDSTGSFVDFQTSNLNYDFSNLDIGEYNVFISVVGEDNIVSDFGTGKNFKVQKQNVINSAIWNGTDLIIDSLYDVDKFEIYYNSDLIFIVSADDKVENQYVIHNLSFAFSKYSNDFNNIFIKSCNSNFALESELNHIYVSLSND